MELNDLEKIRVEKIQRMRSNGIEPYPLRSNPTHQITDAVNAFQDSEKLENPERVEVTLAGRIRSTRPMGKIVFSHIEDSSGRVQLFLRQNDVGDEAMKHFQEDFDLGDFIEASGYMFRTKMGEVSLYVQKFHMLAKAVTPLPAAKDEVVDGEIISHTALSDPEIRYRQRYADLAVSQKVRNIFYTRAAVIRALQHFLDGKGFLEVETPVLQPIYGGAAARPFITHHNQLKQDLYLRISFELYLKRLIVGGLERVYEIGRDFRNEGVSYKHNPEFTQIEFYWAYADYLKVMQLTEDMLAHVCDEVFGKRTFEFNGNHINMNPPWQRIELRKGIIDATGIDIAEHPSAESLAGAIEKAGLKFNPNATRGKLIDGLIGDFLEPNFIQPTFLYDYPRDISPLAKSKLENPKIVERFEGFVGGMELCNAFTELNDPLDQESRFLEMGMDYNSEDEECHPMDEDYLRALSYGMPPTGGFGMGIDRLVMLLTNQHTIREVILFPHLRTREDDKG